MADLLDIAWKRFCEYAKQPGFDMRRRDPKTEVSYETVLITTFHRILTPEEFVSFVKSPIERRLMFVRQMLYDMTGYEQLETPDEVFDAMKMVNEPYLYAFLSVVWAGSTIPALQEMTWSFTAKEDGITGSEE